MSAQLADLEAELAPLGRVVVAFSGGADSALVAKVATDTLGRESVLCATAVSASLPDEEVQAVRSLAEEWQLRWVEVPTFEMDNPAYVANGPDRCAHCKDALMDALVPVAAAEGAAVVLGVNLDDLNDHRPGQAAAQGRGALFPLVRAGFTKADVRRVSADLGLATADKPAAACLASRIPHGVAVTVGTLASVAQAERAVRALGFRQLRVRHHGDLARLEIDPADLGRALECREDLVGAIKAAGYRFVSLDLEGYRSGSLNPSRPGGDQT